MKRSLIKLIKSLKQISKRGNKKLLLKNRNIAHFSYYYYYLKTGLCIAREITF